jgi:hypothetical protein
MINKDKAREIMDDVKAALEAVATKHNLGIGHMGASYEVNGLTVRVPFNVKTSTGDVLTREFRALQAKYPTLAGKTFDVPGQGRITFTGLNWNAPKYPLEYTKAGKRWKGQIGMADVALRMGVEVKSAGFKAVA